jgi:hypothetical protein
MYTFKTNPTSAAVEGVAQAMFGPDGAQQFGDLLDKVNDATGDVPYTAQHVMGFAKFAADEGKNPIQVAFETGLVFGIALAENHPATTGATGEPAQEPVVAAV